MKTLNNYGVVELDRNQQMNLNGGGGNYTWAQVLGMIDTAMASDINTVSFSSNGDGSFNGSGYCIGHNSSNATIWMMYA